MFGISGEHLLVLLVVLLIFGPRRLPDLGNSLGRAIKGFKDATNGKYNEPTESLEKVAAPLQVAAAEESISPKQESAERSQETRV